MAFLKFYRTIRHWLVCVPIVCLGARLGAYVAGRVSHDAIIYLLLGLITLELVTTVLLIPFTPAMIIFTWVTVAVCVVWFAAMLIYRQLYVTPAAPTHLQGICF